MSEARPGNLDTARSGEIGWIVRELNAKEGLTVIPVTHNLRLAALAQRTIELRDGKIDAA